jgi:hypothetical protein
MAWNMTREDQFLRFLLVMCFSMPFLDLAPALHVAIQITFLLQLSSMFRSQCSACSAQGKWNSDFCGSD